MSNGPDDLSDQGSTETPARAPGFRKDYRDEANKQAAAAQKAAAHFGQPYPEGAQAQHSNKAMDAADAGMSYHEMGQNIFPQQSEVDKPATLGLTTLGTHDSDGTSYQVHQSVDPNATPEPYPNDLRSSLSEPERIQFPGRKLGMGGEVNTEHKLADNYGILNERARMEGQV